MSRPGTFTKGTRLWIDGRTATILASEPSQSMEVVFDSADGPESLNLLDLYANGGVRWEEPAPAPALPPASLEQITEKGWDEARRREGILREILGAGETAVRAACEKHSVSRATLFRWKRDYACDGLRGLVPDFSSRGGRGKTRIAQDREKLLDDLLRVIYLRRTRPTQRHTYDQVVAEFRSKSIPPPALRTVRSRIRALDLTSRTAAREGGKKARRHIVSRAQFPSGTRPLQTILVDHTPLDIQIVDNADRACVIGRPYLTLAVDAHTRMVFGYYLSLDPPSYLSVAMCLLQGVLPKDDLIRRFKLAQPWPVFGLPEAVHTDNGKDFRSKHLERFAAQYEITLEYRPVRTPHYGGLIERIIGTVNRFVHALPGTTKSSVADRGDYDAEAHGTFTIEEIEEFLARRVVEHYHVDVHRELAMSPMKAWNDALKSDTFAPIVPKDPNQFRIDLLPYEERTIQKDGIGLHGLHYTDGVLATWRSRSGDDAAQAKYVVKYDPRDLSRVYFLPPDESPPLPIPLANRSLGPFSLLELRRTQALAKLEHRAWSERTMPEMLQRERAALEEATKKSKAARRDAARVRKHREATVPTATSPEPDLSPVESKQTLTTITHVPHAADDGWGIPELRFGGDA